MEKLEPPSFLGRIIVQDTDWKEVRRAGLATDYERVIKFNRELTDVEVMEVTSWVRIVLFWGWAAMPQVTARRDPTMTGAWKFESTVDSS